MANYSYNPEESLSREAFGTPVILQNTESHHIALTNVRCLILQFDQNKQIKPLMAINVGCQLSIINAYSCNHDLILPVFLCPFFFFFFSHQFIPRCPISKQQPLRRRLLFVIFDLTKKAQLSRLKTHGYLMHLN